jgi:UPF0755 protein
MIKKIIFFAFSVLVLVFAFLGIFWYNSYIKTSASDISTSIEIKRGDNATVIADTLFKKKLITSEFWFKAFLLISEKSNKIKAGKYSIGGNNTLANLVEILIAGEQKSNTARIKIIEGWNLNEINDYLIKNNLTPKNNFLELSKHKISDWQFDFPPPLFLKDAPLNADLEGYLFPDTYEIYNNSGGDELIKKMMDNLDLKMDQNIRSEIARQNKSVYEILTMASLIQKEVKTKDMNLVSGIFWKRLKNNQRLQSCATLAYILGVNKEQYSYQDTTIDSPYNTYRNNGLPPGPICNPGLDAIKAAVYPKESDYLFFLTRPDTGETVFSATLDEHNINKEKYLK